MYRGLIFSEFSDLNTILGICTAKKLWDAFTLHGENLWRTLSNPITYKIQIKYFFTSWCFHDSITPFVFVKINLYFHCSEKKYEKTTQFSNILPVLKCILKICNKTKDLQIYQVLWSFRSKQKLSYLKTIFQRSV